MAFASPFSVSYLLVGVASLFGRGSVAASCRVDNSMVRHGSRALINLVPTGGSGELGKGQAGRRAWRSFDDRHGLQLATHGKEE